MKIIKPLSVGMTGIGLGVPSAVTALTMNHSSTSVSGIKEDLSAVRPKGYEVELLTPESPKLTPQQKPSSNNVEKTREEANNNQQVQQEVNSQPQEEEKEKSKSPEEPTTTPKENESKPKSKLKWGGFLSFLNPNAEGKQA